MYKHWLWTMLLCSAALPLCAASKTPDPAADPAWVVQQLKRPTPMRTNFVELRDSPLLKAPLRVSGEYRRPDANTLVRDVSAPYVETTTITMANNGAGTARIVRGKTVRSFALSRAPQLAAMQASFGAMLAGDLAQIEQHYALRASGTRTQWTLLLTPTDKGVAGTIRDITLYGRGGELRCIETRPAKGAEVQRTLLASAARGADGISDGKALATLCRNSGN